MGINVTRPFELAPEVKVPTITPNWGSITAALKGVLKTELAVALEGVEADLQLIADDIAPVLVSAVASGDTKLKNELLAQLAGIAEIHKIRGNAAAWDGLKRVASIVLSVLSIGVGAAVKAATGL